MKANTRKKSSIIVTWTHKDESIPSQWGIIRWEEWCGLECQRINRQKGRAVVEVVTDGNNVSLRRL